MVMPIDLLMIRHGESQGNVASRMAKQKDFSLYTEDFVNTPGRKWRLTEVGVDQAQTTGRWLQSHLLELQLEKRYYVSPFVRTRETAKNLGLTDPLGNSVQWYLNRNIRERDWGEIETMPNQAFLEDKLYRNSVLHRERDPMYWRAPGGESVADVAETRVHNFFTTLQEKCSDKLVVAVSHGEFIRACHLILTRADDEEYVRWQRDPAMLVKNCEVFHYSRRNPASPEELASRITYFRRIYPACIDGNWETIESPWEALPYNLVTNETLMEF